MKPVGIWTAVLAGTFAGSAAGQPAVGARPAAVDCRGDLEFVAAFVLKNDAGLRGRNVTAYPDKVERALAVARKAAVAATSPEACVGVLDPVLKSIRRGHLGAAPVDVPPERSTSKAADPVPPPARTEVRRLSPRTVHVRASSFGHGIRAELVAAIRRNGSVLRNAQNLIIDVRGNGGGSDSSFQPLLELVGPGRYATPNAEILVTDGTLSGWRAVLDHIPASERIDRRAITAILERMQSARSDARRRGQSEVWLPLFNSKEVTIQVGDKDVKARPRRVFVLVDSQCASSCEQFVITVKQNPRVTLIGQRTFGALDAANMRPARTPSGTIDLWYTTTYVRRPPGQEIDEVGIPPAVSLPAPASAAAAARELDAVVQLAEQPGGVAGQSGER